MNRTLRFLLLLLVASLLGVLSFHPSDARADQKVAKIGLTLLQKALCDVSIPSFQERSAEPYATWRKRNSESLRRLQQQDPQSMANRVDKLSPADRSEIEKSMEKATAQERREFEEECDDLIEVFSRTGPDPRLSTPENTWATFIDALKSANRRLALSCLTADARKKLKRPILETLPEEKLVAIANSFSEFRVTMDLGTIREAMVARHDNRAGIIYFYHVDDEWRIGEM